MSRQLLTVSKDGDFTTSVGNTEAHSVLIPPVVEKHRTVQFGDLPVITHTESVFSALICYFISVWKKVTEVVLA